MHALNTLLTAHTRAHTLIILINTSYSTFLLLAFIIRFLTISAIHFARNVHPRYEKKIYEKKLCEYIIAPRNPIVVRRSKIIKKSDSLSIKTVLHTFVFTAYV